MRSRFVALSFAFALACLAVPASAGVLVNRAQVYFEPGTPREDIIISNPAADKAFIEIDVLEVRAPGTPEEKWERATDPDKIGLVAAPRRIAIPAGGQRLVRLVNVNGHDDQEHVYRLHVKPVSGGADAIKGKGFELKVLVGYELLVVIPPKKPTYELNGQRIGKQLILTNTGNANVLLWDGKQCAADNDCATVDTVRVYPGNTRSIELPRDAPVTFSVTQGKDTQPRTFP